MIPYNQKFIEGYEKIGAINNAATASEANTGRINISQYTRFVVIVSKATGQTLAIDVEQADAESGGTLKALDEGLHDMDMESGDFWGLLEFRSEEFDTNPGILSVESFRWLNIEATPGGSLAFSVLVLGLPKSAPAVDTWDVSNTIP